tara:strand:+ start:3166 stop:3339 length:174 start_codon:yes stop_codon:yes gene_type:complete
MVKKKQVWEKPRPKSLGKSKKLKGKKGYSSAKAKADKKFGRGTSLIKNMYISKQMKG